MTKLYLRSFVTLKYTVILPVLIVLSFICMMVFINSGNEVFRYLALGFAAVMVVFLIKYIYERNTVGNQLKNQLQAAGISGIRNICSSLTVLRDQDGEKTEERAFDGQLVSGQLQTVGFFGLF